MAEEDGVEATETEEELDRALVAGLELVRPLHESFRIREAHFPSDLTMAGLGALVWDSANALLLIVRDGRFLSAGYPLARLAFEAGLDALQGAVPP